MRMTTTRLKNGVQFIKFHDISRNWLSNTVEMKDRNYHSRYCISDLIIAPFDTLCYGTS